MQQQHMGLQLRQVRQAPPLRPAAGPPGVQRSRLACYARRTVGGSEPGRNTSTIKRPGKGSSNGTGTTTTTSSSSSSSSSKASSKQAAPPPKQQPPASRNGKSSSSNGRQQQANSPSRLEAFMRDTPGFNRFLDGILIFGDTVMVLATELSSERVPYEQLPALGGVAVGAWVLAGALMGDYALEPDPDANPLSDALGWPIFQAIVDSMLTWAVALVLSLLGYSWLVSNFIVEPEMVLEVPRDGQLSPQLEVAVALLITMSCWRGMAARLRL